MSSRDSLRERLLVTFRMEAREHVATLSSTLIDLESAGSEPAQRLIETAFRVAHSLKGAARSVNLGQIETVCQGMESVFSGLKRQNLTYSRELADLLLHAVRVLEQLLDAAESENPAPLPSVSSLLARLREAATAPRPSTVPPLPAPPRPVTPVPNPSAAPPPESRAVPDSVNPRADRADDLVRVPSSKLDEVWVLAEELLGEKSASAHHSAELRDLWEKVAAFRREWSRAARELRPSARASGPGAASVPQSALEALLERTGHFLENLEQRTAALDRGAEQAQRSLASKVDALLIESRDLLMLPCSWLLGGMRLVVRDLARDQGKDIELVVEGESIELDRRILTELKDPVLHMLRNSVDHGIESGAERTQAGKSARATITITITQVAGNRVQMSVSDDGRGIDPEKVKRSALRLGLIDAEAAERLSLEECLNLVFASEVSTSPMITDLSGRGLGLAIVREKVERLGGSVSITSHVGKGARFDMVLPLSLSTFRGVVVRLGGHFFVVPTLNVVRAARVAKERVHSIENRSAVELDGRAVPVVSMAKLLGLEEVPANETENAWLSLVILGGAGGRVAFVVDEVCQEQDVVVKPLGRELEEVRGVVGATVLASGKIAPILDVPEALRRAVHLGGSLAPRSQASAEQVRKRSILVAEDSITSRTLLKSILEGAGFSVVTAVDGADAFAKLKEGQFDLVVSDVDMPRLNGLGLTQKIRADKALSEIPVVLVTSLESREDRERGVDVGASAYIVKRSFEQSNLLDTIQRLL